MGDFGAGIPPNKAGFCKTSLPRLDGGLYAGQTAAAEKSGGK